MKIYTQVLDILTKIIEFIIIILMGLDVVVMLIQVVGRELGNAPAWTEELARYLMIWIGMLGAAVLVRSKKHIYIEILVDRIKHPAFKKFFSTLTHISIIVVGVILVNYGGYVTKQNMGQISPALRIAFSWVYLSMPLSGALMILYSIEQLQSQQR